MPLWLAILVGSVLASVTCFTAWHFGRWCAENDDPPDDDASGWGTG
jgi:hypothetical protein